MYPVKVVFRVPFGPAIPILAVVVSLVMIQADNPMNVVYGVIESLLPASILFMHGRKDPTNPD